VQIGTLEYIVRFEMMKAIDLSLFTVDLNIPLSSFLMMIPFGIFLPLVWQELRSVKKLIGVGFVFSALMMISRLFAFQSLEIGYFISYLLGMISGYFGFKYIYIFFHKGIAFRSKSESTPFFIHDEAMWCLVLSFIGVFIFYRPMAAMARLPSQTMYPVAIFGYEMRNVVLIPASEIDSMLDEQDELLSDLPEYAYVIWVDDLEEEYIGDTPLCVIFGTCYEGLVTELSEEHLTMAHFAPRPLVIEDTSIDGQIDNTFFTCELHESQEFLLCFEFDGYLPWPETEMQFEVNSDTTIQIWYTDGFGDVFVEEISDWHEIIWLDWLLNCHIRVYPIEIEGRFYAEKVIIYIFFLGDEDAYVHPPAAIRPLLPTRPNEEIFDTGRDEYENEYE